MIFGTLFITFEPEKKSNDLQLRRAISIPRAAIKFLRSTPSRRQPQALLGGPANAYPLA